MDNIIEFPSSGNGSDEPPLSVQISAITADQMLQFCLGQTVHLQASLDAVAILIAKVISMLDESDEKDLITKEEIDSFQRTRRIVLKGLYRELQERFPPKQSN